MTRKKWILLANANANDADQTLRALAASYAPPAVVVARDGTDVLNCLDAQAGRGHPLRGFEGLTLCEAAIPS